MALKENYKDDILDVSQNVKRKYQMENNGDGTVSFTDVTEYTQQGDSFGATDMNAVNSEVNEVVNNLGAKNMLPNNATTRTINGITFTVNSDGSVTVNGTASSLASLFLIGSTSAWGSNQYKNCILSGCPSGGSGDSYRIVMQTSSDGSATSKTYLEDGNGVLIDDDNQYCKIYIRIAGGYTANNLIFKPMIRPSRINDDTYAPYAQTNKELTDNLTASNQTAGVTDVPFRFGCTDDGKFGYIINQGGADTVVPFNSGVDLEDISIQGVTANRSFTAIVGHKYLVSVATYFTGGAISSISGGTIINESSIYQTYRYTYLKTFLIEATSTTITCTLRSDTEVRDNCITYMDVTS